MTLGLKVDDTRDKRYRIRYYSSRAGSQTGTIAWIMLIILETERLMETIKTTAVVKDGRITVDVPAQDGTNFDVVLVPRRTPDDVDAILARINHLRQEYPLQYVNPDTLKAWEEEGRS